MPIEFVGGTVTLSPNEIGDIEISYARDGKIMEIMITSAGKAKVTSIAQVGIEEYLTGVMDIDHFKQHGNIYTLLEPIDYIAGSDMFVSFKDLSGKENLIYLTFVVKY